LDDHIGKEFSIYSSSADIPPRIVPKVTANFLGFRSICNEDRFSTTTEGTIPMNKISPWQSDASPSDIPSMESSMEKFFAQDFPVNERNRALSLDSSISLDSAVDEKKVTWQGNPYRRTSMPPPGSFWA
jgi:hypothetical protein